MALNLEFMLARREDVPMRSLDDASARSCPAETGPGSDFRRHLMFALRPLPDLDRLCRMIPWLAIQPIDLSIHLDGTPAVTPAHQPDSVSAETQPDVAERRKIA